MREMRIAGFLRTSSCWAPLVVLAVAWAVAGSVVGRCAFADVVHLKNGNRVEGDVSEGSEPGKIRVVVDEGFSSEFSKDDVERIERKKSPAAVFDERLNALPPGDLDAHHGLAVWARRHQLRSRIKKLYQRVLRVDPNQPVARRELGYAVYRNRWVLERTLKTKGLVRFDDEWVSPSERDRRVLEKLRAKVDEDFRGCASENKYVQEYSVRNIRERKHPWIRHILVDYIGHPNESVRVVAVQAIAQVTAKMRKRAHGQGDREDTSGRGRRRDKAQASTGGDETFITRPSRQEEIALDERLAKILVDRTLNEDKPVGREALMAALESLLMRRYFTLALEVVRSSPNPSHRDRAALGVFHGLKKAWVPEFIAALGTKPPGVEDEGNPSIRSLLQRAFRRDFGYRVGRWQAWWTENADGYRD